MSGRRPGGGARRAGFFAGPTLLAMACGLLALPVLAQGGAPTLVPAVLRSVQPVGVRRGGAVTFTLEGLNLGEATAAVFDDPAITGTVTQGGNRNQVKVTASVGEAAGTGIHRVYLRTPLGTTRAASFAVGAWPEVAEREPNDTPSTAPEVALPATLVGALSRVGDVDCFRFHADAGEELVFQVVAGAIRSRLNPVLTLLDGSGKTLAEAATTDGKPETVLGYRFPEAGTYALRLRDDENGGGGDFYYRLNAGRFSYAADVYPVGVPAGGGDVTLHGWNLGDGVTVHVPAGVSVLREAGGRPLLSPVRLDVGHTPELRQQAGNSSVTAAQPVPVPSTVNGRLSGAADFYRFSAKSGQKLVLEVAARRFGSPLDSVIEVLDGAGRPVERATLRPVWETAITLKDRSSSVPGLRLLAWDDLHINDYVYIRGQVLQVRALPRGPDDDCQFRTLRGVRAGFFDTTPTDVALNAPVYKVRVYPPDTPLPPNGMPLFHLRYRNDDGGALYGKDSHLVFTAPADGEYVVRLADVRGRREERSPYRLTVRGLEPDFRLSLAAGHPNVPAGAAIPIEVSVDRLDDFDGPIQVRLEGLPKGFYATDTTIEAGETSATLLLTATPGARTCTAALTLVGRARVDGRELVRSTSPAAGESTLTVLPPPDLSVRTALPTVTLAAGGDASLDASITRQNGFVGRVPVDLKNLPFGVKVDNVGLNGVLITEGETSRRIFLHCEPWVQPGQRLVYCTARTETASSEPTEVATPFVLEIKGR